MRDSTKVSRTSFHVPQQDGDERSSFSPHALRRAHKHTHTYIQPRAAAGMHTPFFYVTDKDARQAR